LSDDALPAVTVPSFWNDGRSPGSLSMLPRPGSSSVSTLISPFLSATLTATISALKCPCLIASCARR
jgi:hypothetical protein